MTLSRLETFLWDQSERRESDLRQAERIVIVLRRMLRERDASLPFELDGTAWSEIEAPYLAEDAIRFGRSKDTE